MDFTCDLMQSGDGSWIVRHAGRDVGEIETVAHGRDEAIEKMRQEIRYRLELCPCSGELYQHVNVRVVPR